MRKFSSLFIIIITISACKKDPVTVPVAFTSTTYQTLGSYDNSGTPSYLVTPRDNISPTLLSYINNTLVEKTDLRKSNPALLSTQAIADIAITQPSDAYVTFVFTLTNNANALAFYTYPTATPPASAKDIQVITYIFPSVGSGTKLKAGDKVKIGRFQAGTSIGFVLLQDAWVATTKTLNNNVVHFCSNDVLNPEVDPNLKKHAVLINYTAENKTLIGFENTNRTDKKCDNDFNDVVFYATVTP